MSKHTKKKPQAILVRVDEQRYPTLTADLDEVSKRHEKTKNDIAQAGIAARVEELKGKDPV